MQRLLVVLTQVLWRLPSRARIRCLSPLRLSTLALAKTPNATALQASYKVRPAVDRFVSGRVDNPKMGVATSVLRTAKADV